MKDLDYVAGEISKGKNLEMNLPKYANSMISLYHGLAYIKMSMNYYTFYEMLSDSNEMAVNKPIKDIVDRLNIIIEKEIIKDTGVSKLEDSVASIDGIRNEIIKVMEVVTSYVDKLRIYEYILNRVESRFSEEVFDDTYYNKNLTNDIMHYILSDKDTMITNSKISEVVGQLPMRMSKGKFYEYIKEAFTLYRGAQKGTIDDFVYTLRTVSMLDTPEKFDETFSDIHEMYNSLKDADYKNIDKDEYKRLYDILVIATERINTVADSYVMAMQLVNDVYTILLSKMYAFSDVDEVEKGKYVIGQVLNGFIGKTYEPEDEKIFDAFTTFEGKQEKILTTISTNDFAIEYSLNHESLTISSLVLDKIYNSLEIISKLQSESDFVMLSKNADQLELASDCYVDEAANKLIEEFDTAFKEQGQIVNRAVMSTILSQLPVFFNSVDDIQNYINVSLLQCNDTAEKMATVEVMNLLLLQN